MTDLATAHVLALQYLLRGGENCALNLGTGQGHSVREVIESVEKFSGRSVPVTLSPRREGDPPILVAQSARATEVLNWSPRLSSIEKIVRTALSWQQSLTSSKLEKEHQHAESSVRRIAAGAM